MRLALAALTYVLLLAAASSWTAPVRIASIESPAIDESSGIAASLRYPGSYWTHNDSGDGPVLFLFDMQEGLKAAFTLAGARSFDWEDIARRGQNLYVGDIGDNDRARRQVQVYRLPEPEMGNDMPKAETLRFRYPDDAHDAEALLVHPVTGDLYIVTKAHGSDTKTLVFKARAPLRAGPVVAMERVASLRFPEESPIMLLIGRVTGGDISPDGQHVMLCDYQRGWEYTLPKGAEQFDAIWKTTPVEVDLGPRRQGEAVCYRVDGKAVLATSEGSPMPVFEVRRTQ